ncbi:MAG: glycoside hydrolase family 15 protein [Candidatus Binatus sp.]|uniref:glycoside hydrolase family 15 protein n=1 Tax=Candidatus Binatus sp. TaxID=2811406 RepID=UPI00271ABF04|nr:glycoside hydrolase family 15 protein [Candidatus Binatus sp.]MDO8434023.1 glycoside hydrolase family 15 protein [Candidatus Binatus sp.]
MRIEDYALIGNTRTAALVGRDGSIDWLCMPRFDSAACFASILGNRDNGRWLLAPKDEPKAVRRRYSDGTLILETEFETAHGAARVIDLMPVAEHRDRVDVVRIVKGINGTVSMRMEAIFRFNYGRTVPWMRRRDYGYNAIAGPDAVALRASVPMRGKDFTTVADFEVAAGQTEWFTLTWYPSHEAVPHLREAAHMLEETEAWWREWLGRCSVDGEWRDACVRSLITLKALTYGPTGGIVAAPTTSLPESIGGPRNWDYRFCWLRDATFTLYALLTSGYVDEAREWREWLLRAIAGDPKDMQIMYGLAGERTLPEFEIPWLTGYEGSRPVRIGNAAHLQFQLDVYGEVMDALYVSRGAGIRENEEAWRLQRELMDFLETGWKQPDEGIWEVRGPRQHFTHSKVMAWLAVDRAVKEIEKFHAHGPVARWRALRSEIHDDVCRRGFDAERNSFVQHYGSKNLDASLLMIPLVGFLPPGDFRVQGTLEAIQRELLNDGLVKRYSTSTGVDGLPPGEGAFLPCTFWYADNLAVAGRYREAREVFERLLSLRNDVGLLAEEYDFRAQRQVGNFPQAFTHVSLINTAHNLTRLQGPAMHRSQEPAIASTNESHPSDRR